MKYNKFIQMHREMLADSQLTPEEQSVWLQKLQDAYDKVKLAQSDLSKTHLDVMIFGEGKMSITEDEIIHIPYGEDDERSN